MSIPIPFSVTVEDAVARMVNMDYIPEGFTLVEMTAAFLEEAEVEHHNAIVNLLPAGEIAALQIRMDACKARHLLTQLLLDALNHEIANPEGSMIVLSGDSDIQPCLTIESVISWADENFGILISKWPHDGNGSDETNESVKNARWEDVTIKIYKDDMVEDYPNYRLAYFSEKTGPKGREKYFQDIGLMGKRKNVPNTPGGILIGLGLGEKYPRGINPGKELSNSEAVAITRIRTALKMLTDIKTDPFTFNKTDGYKPRFKLVDATNVANERAQNRARHDSYDENDGQHNDGHDDDEGF